MARDNHALDLIGSVPDLVDLGVPEVSLEAAGIACASQSPEKEVSTRASHDPVQLTVTPPSKATIAAAVPGSLNSLQEGRGAAQKTETGSRPSTIRMRSKWWIARSATSGWRSSWCQRALASFS